MDDLRCTAFLSSRKVASGSLVGVADAVRTNVSREDYSRVLTFDDATGRVVEIDFGGEVSAPMQKAAVEEAPRGPGRPKLGVVGREVTLLPRHWEWLEMQPGGASVALRKLVEEARKVNADADRIRMAQEAAYRFMSAMAGDRAGFEEAVRALYAGDWQKFEENMRLWPLDIRDYAAKLAEPALERVPEHV